MCMHCTPIPMMIASTSFFIAVAFSVFGFVSALVDCIGVPSYRTYVWSGNKILSEYEANTPTYPTEHDGQKILF